MSSFRVGQATKQTMKVKDSMKNKKIQALRNTKQRFSFSRLFI